MLYARVDSSTKEIVEYPLHGHEVKRRLLEQNVSLPADLYSADLSSFGYYKVPPQNNQPLAPAGYRAVLAPPTWNGDLLERTWALVPIDNDFRTRMWQVVRNRRNKLLKESDWTELPSVRAVRSAQWGADWDTYRQALRDVTKIEHPTMVIFPRKPNETE